MQKFNVAIKRQGLSAVCDWIARLRGAGTASAKTVRMEFRLVIANGTCHEVCGRNYIR